MVYVYDGDYLTSGLRKVLIKLSERFEDSCYSINNGGSRENCQHHSLRVIRVSRYFSIIDTLHDPKLRFNYVSMVGGIFLNRQIERKALKKNYKNTSYSLFSFFMALFCQSFASQFSFNPSTNLMEQVDGEGCINYESRFDVCAAGHVCCTISYDSNSVRNSNFSHQGERIMYVYKLPILDLSVDMDRESNGYYPGVKGSYIEQFVYNKYCDGPQYEDRGIKHLYKQHHRCTTESGGLCE